MANQSTIEWCDSTLNVQMGCDGCELWTGTSRHCYAGVLTERYAGRNGWPTSFDQPKLFLHRLDAALKWPDLRGKARPEKPWIPAALPRLIFLNDMGDTFTESLPEDWLAPLLPRIADSPHQFLLLTKRGRRLRDFSERHPFPTNVWPGVSVTRTNTLRRVHELLGVRGGGPKWVSAEPLLERIDFLDMPYPDGSGSRNAFTGQIRCKAKGVNGHPDFEVVTEEPKLTKVAWLVAGGESGPDARQCSTGWIRSLVHQCRDTQAKCFVKQLGSRPHADEPDIWSGWTDRRIHDPKGGDIDEFPTDLRVRQFPEVA